MRRSIIAQRLSEMHDHVFTNVHVNVISSNNFFALSFFVHVLVVESSTYSRFLSLIHVACSWKLQVMHVLNTVSMLFLFERMSNELSP